MPVATYYRRQKLVWEQESRKLPEKSIGSQMIQAEENQLVPVNFEPVPSPMNQFEVKARWLLRKMTGLQLHGLKVADL